MSDGVQVNNIASLFPLVCFIMLLTRIESDYVSACTLCGATVGREILVMKQSTEIFRIGKMRPAVRSWFLEKRYGPICLGCVHKLGLLLSPAPASVAARSKA